MELRAAKNIIPPRFVFPLVIESIKEVISGQPFAPTEKSSALWEDFSTKVGALSSIDAAIRASLLAEARAALVEVVGPAYEKLIKVLVAQQQIATDDDGVWKFADGLDYYAFALRGSTTTQLTAAEIHQLGLSEVARIHQDMAAIMQQVGFKGDRQAFLNSSKRTRSFIIPRPRRGKQPILNARIKSSTRCAPA